MNILTINKKRARSNITSRLEKVNSDIHYSSIENFIFYEIDEDYNIKREITRSEMEEMMEEELYTNYIYLCRHPELIRDNIDKINSGELIKLYNESGINEVTRDDLYKYIDFEDLGTYQMTNYLETVLLKDRLEEIIDKLIKETNKDGYHGEMLIEEFLRATAAEGQYQEITAKEWTKRIFNKEEMSIESKVYMINNVYTYNSGINIEEIKKSLKKEDLEQYFKLVNLGERNSMKVFNDELIFKNLGIIEDPEQYDKYPYEVQEFIRRGNSIMAGNVIEFKTRMEAFKSFMRFLTIDNYEDYIDLIRDFIEDTVDNVEFYRIKEYNIYSDSDIKAKLNEIIPVMILETFNDKSKTHGLTLKGLVRNYIKEYDKDTYREYGDNLFNYDFINNIPDKYSRYKNVIKKVKLELKLK